MNGVERRRRACIGRFPPSPPHTGQAPFSASGVPTNHVFLGDVDHGIAPWCSILLPVAVGPRTVGLYVPFPCTRLSLAPWRGVTPSSTTDPLSLLEHWRPVCLFLRTLQQVPALLAEQFLRQP